MFSARKPLTVLSIGLIGFAIWQSKLNQLLFDKEKLFGILTGQSRSRGKGFYDQINNEHCKLIPLPAHAEDPFIDYETDLMYITMGDTHKEYFPPLNRYDYPGPHQDKVYVMDLANDNQAVEYKFSQDYTDDFFTHGVDIFKTSTGDRLLYSVNHLLEGSVISAFKIDDENHELKFVRHYHHPLIYTPNSLAVVDDRSFFFTNDHGYKTGILRTIEDQTLGKMKKSSIGYCHFDEKEILQCELKSTGHPYCNGIRFNKDRNLLFVGDTMSGELKIFKVDPQTRDLEKMRAIGTGTVIDNLHLDEHQNIYAGCAQNATTLLASIADPDSVPHVPFMGVRLNANTDYTTIDRVLTSNGTLANGKGFAGISTVVPDTKRHKIYLGSHSSSGLIVCENIIF